MHFKILLNFVFLTSEKNYIKIASFFIFQHSELYVSYDYVLEISPSAFCQVYWG